MRTEQRAVVPCDWCVDGKVLVPGPVKGHVQEENCWKCGGTNRIEVRG